MNILDELAAYARERVETAKKKVPLAELRSISEQSEKGGFEFENALKKPGISFICECKKASPSKGIISADFPYMKIAEEYDRAGADCISVLTEPKWFLGNDKYLKEIAASVSAPCIRKDFLVDEYMIYEAKTLGAKAVLLICSILSGNQIQEYMHICDSLGLSALVEAHDADEIQIAISAGARMIGVNNRNLKDFSVDTSNSGRLRTLVPDNIIFVAESGVKTADDVRSLSSAGANAVLIGETLMRAENISDKLRELRGLS